MHIVLEKSCANDGEHSENSVNSANYLFYTSSCQTLDRLP